MGRTYSKNDPLKVSRLYVDGHNLLWRAYAGFPSRILSRSGRDITTIFGFIALLRKAIHWLDCPVVTVVVFDGEEGWESRLAVEPDYKSGRTEGPSSLFEPDYKSGRTEGPSSLFEDLKQVKEALTLIDIPWLEYVRAEADDVIAAIWQQQKVHAYQQIIFSTDRDYHQLIDCQTKQLITVGSPGYRLIGEKEVVSRFGVMPTQWSDFRSLVGDASDSIPGVRGIGNIRASQFLKGGVTLEEAKSLGRLTGSSWGKLIKKQWEDVIRWRSIIRLPGDFQVPEQLFPETDLPLPSAAQVCEIMGLWE